MKQKKIKILYHIPYVQGMGDDRFTYDGFKGAFEDLGHEVFPFTEEYQIKDLLDSIKPDIFIATRSTRNWDPVAAAPIIQKHRKRGMKMFMRTGSLRVDHYPGLYDDFIA